MTKTTKLKSNMELLSALFYGLFYGVLWAIWRWNRRPLETSKYDDVEEW